VGRWKLVRKYPDPWELYDLERDRTELNDLSAQNPERVREMLALYEGWAARCGVIPRETILEVMARNPEPAFWEKEDE
jgi:arylsulfatase